MAVAATVDLEIDQGADFAFQIYWTDSFNQAYYLAAPMRMEIHDEVGNIALTLQTNETSEDEESNPDNQSILFNAESGLIQLMLTSDQTDTLVQGSGYVYDLFVNYVDTKGSGAVRKRRLIKGRITVNGRTTRNV